jgi:DNA polymerase III delta prime subunit
MQELALERETIKAALEDLHVDAWVFEEDAGARPQSIETTYRDELEAADVYIGLFWKGFGPHTAHEYEHAMQLGRDCLIYCKRLGDGEDQDAELGEFLERIGHTATGHCIKLFDSSVDLADCVKQDVAAWQTRVIRDRSLTVRRPTLPGDLMRRRLLILLAKVRSFWIKGVLEKSLHNTALIELGRDESPDLVDNPWNGVMELPDQTHRGIPAATKLLDVFEEAGRALLILGDPGAGKTTTLLQLARELANRAERDASQPIPVVFNLSSWGLARPALRDWMVSETKRQYQIPKRVARQWIDGNFILPLLDGLDEVPEDARIECVEAINAFAEDIGLAGLIVCSRLDEYQALPLRLQLNAAVRLQPLALDQADRYLLELGQSSAGLRSQLEADQTLQLFARSPLMLTLMALAYRDMTADEIAAHQPQNAEERRRHVLTTYVNRSLAEDESGGDYEIAETIDWLSWLARGMRRHAQSIFFIERLQPSWLSTAAARWSYMLGSRMTSAVVFGLAISPLVYPATSMVGGFHVALEWILLFGLSIGLVDGLRFRKGATVDTAHPRYRVALNVFAYIVLGTTFGTVLGAFAAYLSDALALRLWWGSSLGLLLGLVFGLVFGIRGSAQSLTQDIRTVERLGWSWPGSLKGALAGIFVGPAAGLLLGLLLLLVFGSMGAVGMLAGAFYIPMGLLAGLVAGIATGSLYGGLEGQVSDRKTLANEGIRLTLRTMSYCFVATIAVIIVVGAASGVVVGAVSGWGLALPIIGLTAAEGLVLALPVSLWFGGFDVIQHYALRLELYRRGGMPLRYARFLDHAARIGILQKVGSGYLFSHARLQQHFEAMTRSLSQEND